MMIPYEKQNDPQAGCGAACLSMVYKSLGKDIAQGEIWPRIAKANRFGIVSSTTHLMALDALGQGFSAIAIQARHPLQVLRLCRDGGIRAILNHRPGRGASNGHYTVLVGIDDKSVIVHDPSSGPLRRISHEELTELWQPPSGASGGASEIPGNVILGIAAEPAAIAACEFCRTPMPAKVDCPRCKKAVGLSPAVLLGCIRDGCIARMWNYVACPSCDFMWSFNEAGVSTGDLPRASAAPPAAAPLMVPDVEKAFAQLDQLCARMLGVAGAENHPDLKIQVDFIQATKDKFRIAQAEEITALRARMEQIASAQKSKNEAKEERRKQEELDASAAPLDGNALREALLKNLGFK